MSAQININRSNTFAYGWYVINVETGEVMHEGPLSPRDAGEKRLDLVMANETREDPYEVWCRDRHGEFRRRSF